MYRNKVAPEGTSHIDPGWQRGLKQQSVPQKQINSAGFFCQIVAEPYQIHLNPARG